MRRTIAITTAITLTTLLAWTPTSSAATSDDRTAELLLEDHFHDQGFTIDLFVTKSSDGTILSEATVRDPTSTDEVDVWTDGTTVWWDGIVRGEHVEGHTLATHLIGPTDPAALFCLHPIAAIVCLGGAVVLLGGCAFGFSCEGTEPETNPPDSSGHGQGGGGDGESGEENGDGDGDQ